MNAGGGASDQTFTTTTGSGETYDGLLTTLKMVLMLLIYQD